MSEKERVTQIIRDNYSVNKFVQLCDILIDDVECGTVRLSMPISSDKHTNMYSVVHGGALASLGDTALGAACASVGCRAVTVDYTVNFLRNIHAGDTAIAVGTVLKQGRSIIVVRVEIFNKENVLLTEMQGTMFVTGPFEDIPSKW